MTCGPTILLSSPHYMLFFNLYTFTMFQSKFSMYYKLNYNGSRQLLCQAL